MKNKYIAVTILLIAAAMSIVVLTAFSPEKKYIESRDLFIQMYEKTMNLDEKPALAQLEKQLRAIVGPIRIDGFPKEGTINLETLQKGELGFGQVDGLSFESGQASIFVTTNILLDYYLKEHPELPRNIDKLSRNVDFHRLTFFSDAAVTYYAELPTRTSTKNKTYTYAFLGLVAQDIGHFLPKDIFVFVSKGNRILMATAPASVEVTDIPTCKNEWEIFSQKSSEKLEAYQASRLTNQKDFDDHLSLEEQGFEAYTQCFGKEAKYQRYFVPLTKQAENLAELLIRN